MEKPENIEIEIRIKIDGEYKYAGFMPTITDGQVAKECGLEKTLLPISRKDVDRICNQVAASASRTLVNNFPDYFESLY